MSKENLLRWLESIVDSHHFRETGNVIMIDLVRQIRPVVDSGDSESRAELIAALKDWLENKNPFYFDAAVELAETFMLRELAPTIAEAIARQDTAGRLLPYMKEALHAKLHKLRGPE